MYLKHDASITKILNSSNSMALKPHLYNIMDLSYFGQIFEAEYCLHSFI